MAVNAGLIIPGTQSSMSYDSNAGIWKGITIEINYILGQSGGANPPSIGDILVDQEPRVWEITATGGSLSGNRFVVDVKCLSESSSLQAVPKLNTQRGMICSPNTQGFVDPHWDGTVVELSPFRMAMRYNFNMNPSLGSLGSGGSSEGGFGIPKARSIVNSPPSYLQNGEVYIVGTNPSGIWSNKAEKIATYSNGSWTFTNPGFGDIYWVENSNNYYYYSHLGSWDVFEPGGGSTGSTNFLQLNDTPSSFSGKAGYLLRVNTSSSAVEFVDPSNFSSGGGDTGGGDTGGGDTGGSGDGGGGSGVTYNATIVSEQTSVSTFPVKAKAGDVFNPTVATTESHFVMIGSDGNLYLSGDNSIGQFGNGNTDGIIRNIPGHWVDRDFNWYSFSHGINYKKVYARYDSTACIDESDVLYVWGDNREKKLGSNTVPFLTKPERIDTPVGVKKFEIGEVFSYYQGMDNYLYRSDRNGGFSKFTNFQIKDFAYNGGNLVVAKTDGNVYTATDPVTNSNYSGIPTLSLSHSQNYYLKNLFSAGILKANYDAMNYDRSCAVKGITEYYTIYDNEDKIIESIWDSPTLAPTGASQVLFTIHNYEYTHVVTRDGRYLCYREEIGSSYQNLDISNVNYVTAIGNFLYIIFNDGSINRLFINITNINKEDHLIDIA